MLDLYAIGGLILAVIAAIATAFLKGRSSGRANERAKQDRATIDAYRTREETDEDIDRLGDSDVRDRLSKWSRD